MVWKCVLRYRYREIKYLLLKILYHNSVYQSMYISKQSKDCITQYCIYCKAAKKFDLRRILAIAVHNCVL